MNLKSLTVCGAMALLLGAGAAVADTNQFGPFADDRLYLDGFDIPSDATQDTKAEVYDDVYEDDDLYGDEFIDDFEDPELWVGMDAGVYVD